MYVCYLIVSYIHTTIIVVYVTVYKYRTWISINCWSKKWEYMDLALIATGGGVKSGYDKGIKMLARPSIAQHCLVKRCKTFLPVMRIWCVCFRAASIPADCTSHSISTPERVVVWYLLFRKLEVSITFYFYCSSTVSQHLCSVALLRTLRMMMQLPAGLNSSSCSCGTFSRNFYPCTAKLLSTMDWKAKWVGGGNCWIYCVKERSPPRFNFSKRLSTSGWAAETKETVITRFPQKSLYVLVETFPCLSVSVCMCC